MTLFQSEEAQRSFHCWLMHLVPESQCKHQNLCPPTIRSKNLSPSPSYCIRCSKQTPIRIAFFSSFQLFGTHNAETFQYSRTCMMMCCTYLMLMPKCYTIINLHHLILLGMCLGPKRGVDNWGMPSPQCCSYPLWISFTSQALLYAAKGHRHTHTSFKNECTLSCTFCAQKLNDAVLCLIGQICDSSPLCRHYSEHSADNVCPSWSLVTNVGWHKNDQPYITHNPTLCVVRLFYNKHYIFIVVHTTKWAKHSNNGPLLQENVQMFQKKFAGEDAILLLVQSSCIAEKSFIEWGSLIFGGKYYWHFQNNF
jgi:hypothetical protein